MRIDTSTIQIPFEALNGINYESPLLVRDTRQSNEGVLVKDIHSTYWGKYEKPVGVSGITINNQSNLVKIQTSAKVLTDQYLEGLTLNTYSQFIDRINALGIVNIDPQRAFSEGQFLSLDTTNNVDMASVCNMDKHWKEVLSYLDIAKLNDRFSTTTYSTKSNQGIVYKGNQQEKNRLIMYRKFTELNSKQDKKKQYNADFFKALSNPVQYLESTRHILRVESNHTTFNAIRTRLQVPSNKVSDVLTYGQNPNPLMLDKITQPHRQNQLLMVFNEYNPEEHSIQDIVELEGIKNIIRMANYQESTLKAFVARYTTEAMFRWWWYGGKKSVTPFRPLIDELKKKDQNIDPQANKIIDHIKQFIHQDKVA